MRHDTPSKLTRKLRRRSYRGSARCFQTLDGNSQPYSGSYRSRGYNHSPKSLRDG
jgi:hypothetical protein